MDQSDLNLRGTWAFSAANIILVICASRLIGSFSSLGDMGSKADKLGSSSARS
jgi:hypothetical protein